MPAVNFRVRWPDASMMLCYSPSSTIKDAFVLGVAYPVDDFVTMSRAALEHASMRVAQKFGFGCGHAHAQIEAIEARAAAFRFDPGASVIVESFED